jgi:diaminopimelate decarboxylase/aspartate kinase
LPTGATSRWSSIAANKPATTCWSCTSAITKITDMLEKLLAAAQAGNPEEALKAIEDRHKQLTTDLGVGVSPQLQGYFDELRQMANGIALVRELSDRTRARVMANGELMATEIGARFLKAQGVDVTWMDARDMLKAEDRGASAKASVLSATCSFAPDAALEARLEASTPVVITQGFIARDSEGNTCLLGRGGSDTSAAYLGAKIRARQIEIWTDVPGMFSANPRATPTARLIRALHYDEAQEIATSGAKVLHPRCLLPARQYQIPLYVLATQTPDVEGTLITGEAQGDAAQVKAVCNRKGITLISLDSPGMWHQVGFMADAFAVFKEHGMSVDLVSTSETNVTVSLDPAANTLDGELLGKLQRDLSKLSNVRVIGPCASVSLVGRNIRAILHKLGDAFALFEEQKVYLVSQAANDLNFTFVVDENQGDRLVEQLHDLLIRPSPGDLVMGPTWEQLFNQPSAKTSRAQPWWSTKRDVLLGALATRDSAYVYDLAQVEAAAKSIAGLKSIGRALYALKANPNPDILRKVAAQGVGFDCVSLAEIERVLEAVPGIKPDRILFTPNFAPRAEYERALALGRTRHHRQPVRAAALARRLQGQERVPAHRHRHRPRPSPPREDGRRAVQVRHPGGGAGRSRTAGEAGRRHRARPACTCWQRRIRCRELDPGGLGARGPREAFPRCEVHRRGRGPWRTRSRRGPRARSRTPRRGAGPRERCASRRRAVDRAGSLLRGQRRRIADTRHADQGQERHSLRRRVDGHELADPPGAVRRASRHREPDALRRTGQPGRPRGGADLRELGFPRP